MPWRNWRVPQRVSFDYANGADDGKRLFQIGRKGTAVIDDPSTKPATPVRTVSVPKLALTRNEAAKALSCGIRSVDQLIAGRRGNGFPVAYVGTKPLIPVNELKAWLAKQAGKGGGQ